MTITTIAGKLEDLSAVYSMNHAALLAFRNRPSSDAWNELASFGWDSEACERRAAEWAAAVRYARKMTSRP